MIRQPSAYGNHVLHWMNVIYVSDKIKQHHVDWDKYHLQLVLCHSFEWMMHLLPFS